MVMVDFPGPPFVRFRDSSNSCSVPLVEVIVVSRIIGYAAAMSILILIMVAILALIQMKVGDER